MNCPNCGNENNDDAKFCKKCGTPLKSEINHQKMINSQNSSNDNTTKYIIIALAVIAIVLAGAFVYIYSSGLNQSNDSQPQQVDDNDDVNNSVQTNKQSEKTAETTSSPSSMSILGGSFSTGSGESDKTYARINVGTSHAGENVIVQIFYSRDGNSLNHGNMVPATVHSDGYLEIASADAYHYYPDYATIKIYDSNRNLLTTQSVALSPTSGTQTF